MNRSNAFGSSTDPAIGVANNQLRKALTQKLPGRSAEIEQVKEKSRPTTLQLETTSTASAQSAQNAAERPLAMEHGHVHEHSGGHAHQHSDHVHDDESIRRIVNRLSRIEGHVRGLKRMVQEQENCPDVLIQVAAVRGALDKVARLILDEHLTQCVLRAAEQGNIEAEIEELQAALNRFLP